MNLGKFLNAECRVLSIEAQMKFLQLYFEMYSAQQHTTAPRCSSLGVLWVTLSCALGPPNQPTRVLESDVLYLLFEPLTYLGCRCLRTA